MFQRIGRAALPCAMGALGFMAAGLIFYGVSGGAFPAKPRCIILNNGCWTASPWAYNDQAAKNSVVADAACYLGNMMNFVWCNEYAGSHPPLFAHDGGRGGFEGDLTNIYSVLRDSYVKAIIYVNNPGTLSNFLYPNYLLPAIVALERIRQEYPEAAPDVDIYLRILFGSVGYQKAVEEYGVDWRQRVYPDALSMMEKQTLAVPQPEPAAQAAKSQYTPAPRGLRHLNAFLRAAPKRLANLADGAQASFTNRSFYLYDRSVDALCHLPLVTSEEPRLKPTFDKNKRIVELLDGCAARYLNPFNDAPVRRLMKKEDIWSASAGFEVFQAWANIVAKMCRRRGVHFVWYVPPHLHVARAEYEQSFQPEFVVRVQQAFAHHTNVLVLDQALASGFNAADLVWYTTEHLKKGNVNKLKNGYFFNAIGRLKQSRLLVAALIEAGLLEAELPHERYLGSAWAGERSLPSVVAGVPLVPEEQRALVEENIYWPDMRIRSKQLQAQVKTVADANN